jgi:hypothetical protein
MNPFLLLLRIDGSSSPVSATEEERGPRSGIGEGPMSAACHSPSPCFARGPLLSRFAGEDVWSVF